MKVNYMTKEDLTKLINESQNDSFRVESFDYNIGGSRDSFFNRESNIYDEFGDNIDDLSFYQNNISILKDVENYKEDFCIMSVFDCLTLDIEDLEDLQLTEGQQEQSEDYELNFLNLSEQQQKVLIDYFDNLEDEEIEDIEGLSSVLFGCDYFDEHINNATYEALAYWTVYFEPDVFDSEIAIKCGLIPFTYKDTDYLAFGGCGMDLSPKLDAYIALTCGWLPKETRFTSDNNYFKYVCGSVMQEIEKKCKLEKTLYKIEF